MCVRTVTFKCFQLKLVLPTSEGLCIIAKFCRASLCTGVPVLQILQEEMALVCFFIPEGACEG